MSNNSEKEFNKKLAILSHEVKTPLALIANTAYVANLRLKDNTISHEELKKYFENILNNCYKLDLITDNMMNLTEIQPTHYQVIDMNEFCEKFSAQLEALHSSYDFDFKLDVKTDSEKKNIPIPPTERVILNLITNAIKYNSKKTKKVTLTVSNDEKFVYFTVKDNGDGISEEMLPRITEEYFRVSMTQASGLGLGLNVVSKIVKNAGGELTFKSQLKKGTEVTFTLPVNGNPSILSFNSDNYEYKPSKVTFLKEFSTLEKL